MKALDGLNLLLSSKLEYVQSDATGVLSDLKYLVDRLNKNYLKGVGSDVSNIVRRLVELQSDLSYVTSLQEAVKVSEACEKQSSINFYTPLTEFEGYISDGKNTLHIEKHSLYRLDDSVELNGCDLKEYLISTNSDLSQIKLDKKTNRD